MTDKPELTREQCGSARPEELCAAALRHYDELSTKACSWMNQIPQAIRFWYLEKPKLEAELRALSVGMAGGDNSPLGFANFGLSTVGEVESWVENASKKQLETLVINLYIVERHRQQAAAPPGRRRGRED